jgi:hypothetical protein
MHNTNTMILCATGISQIDNKIHEINSLSANPIFNSLTSLLSKPIHQLIRCPPPSTIEVSIGFTCTVGFEFGLGDVSGICAFTVSSVFVLRTVTPLHASYVCCIHALWFLHQFQVFPECSFVVLLSVGGIFFHRF